MYLHGFLSSPQSIKAQQTLHYLSDSSVTVSVPELPSTPGACHEYLRRLVSHYRDSSDSLGLIGSSLGGFFATVLAEEFALKAVLVNPAVRPHTLMELFLGENTNPYSGECFVLDERHVAEFRDMEPLQLNPERYWVLLQQGDETLDYRAAQAYYTACRMTVEEGGDHSFQGYQAFLPDIMQFLQLDN